MRAGWTFAIAFGGNHDHLSRLIESIRRLGLSSFEILVAYEESLPFLGHDVKTITLDSPIEGWLTGKKNALVRTATFNQVCILHDYLELHPDWASGFETFGDDWNICSSPTLNPFRDMARVSDWLTLDHPFFGASLLPYSIESESQFMYISGMYYCVKKDFIVNNELWLNEDLGHGQAEDQEWSIRVRRKTEFRFNPNSIVLTQKDKHYYFLKERRFPWLRLLATRMLAGKTDSHALDET